MHQKKCFRLLTFLVSIFLGSLGSLAQTAPGTYMFKTKLGYMVVQNRQQVSFLIEFKGEKLEPLESDHPKFIIDGKRIQIVTVRREEFWQPKEGPEKEPNDEQLLEAHKGWEAEFVGESMKVKLFPISQFLELSPKRKIMFWSLSVPKGVESQVSHYLFLSTVIGRNILSLNAAPETADGQASHRAYLIESMGALQTSDKPYDIQKLKESFEKITTE